MWFQLRRGDFLKPLSASEKVQTLVPDQAVSVPLWGPCSEQSWWIRAWSAGLFRATRKDKNPSPGLSTPLAGLSAPQERCRAHTKSIRQPLWAFQRWICSLLQQLWVPLKDSHLTVYGITLNLIWNCDRKVHRLPVTVSGCKNAFKAINGQVVFPSKSWLQMINQQTPTMVRRLPCGAEETGSAHWLVPEAKMESSLTSPHFNWLLHHFCI